MFRGREIVFSAKGFEIFQRIIDTLADCSNIDVPPKLFGNTLSMILSPGSKEKKNKEKKHGESKKQQISQEEI